jgi:hypothetical protein
MGGAGRWPKESLTLAGRRRLTRRWQEPITCLASLLTGSASSRQPESILNSRWRFSVPVLFVISPMQYSQAAAAALTTVLCMLGYPAAALRKSGELLAAVRRLSDPASLARVLNRDAVLHTELGNSRSALERAEELISIATEHGLAFTRPPVSFIAVGRWPTRAGRRGSPGCAGQFRTMVRPRREP